jgi:amino acid adenylation domain-containing protein
VGNTQVLDVPGELYDRVAAFARERGLTPFMVMMAVWQALLHRMSGQADFAIATTVANRQRAELEGLIGMLVNTIVLRANCTGTPRFDELLERTRRAALGAYAHQDLPFELLVQELAPRRDFSHNPLFQVMFSFHDAPVPDLAGGGLTGEIDYRHNGSAKFDMNVVVLARREQRVGRERDAGREVVTIELEYNTDLFDHETISGMLDHYRVMLEDAIAHPDRPVHELEMLTPDERTALLHTWNDTAADWPDDRCVHDLVFARAAERPDAPAVGCDGGALGVGPGDRVAVCLHRSTDMLVALLGTLASGAAYVPMDPDHPRARLEHQLGDGQVAALIRGADSADGLDAGSAHVIRLDEPLDGDAASALPQVDPGSAAYVIYTSGSTGVPKGVVVPHRALVNFLRSMERITGMTERDVLLAVTTISFDIAGLELYLPLMLGARVEIATRGQVADGRELVSRLSSSGATVMQATPAAWRLLRTAGWEGDDGLLALCGGEALPADLAQELRGCCRTLINLYGPTETTIWSAWHAVDADDDPVPIGRPLHNTTIHVLDAHGGLQPPRLPGEIAIGGAGVAIGYLDRPELTAERFVPDPFDTGAGARLYRTGDLGRRRADGTLEFLTRLDSQVKLRGFRIELGEIETLLRELPGVADCAAGVVEYGPGDRRMVAWVVLADGAELQAETWRAALGERLPEYMLPSTWVPTDELPLTPNGKLDRKALPRPEALAPARAPEDGPPTTDMERSLAAIWTDVLGAPHVSVFDNFFDLGGHSLLTVQVAARVESEHGVHLTPRDLMLQNLGQLAAVCEERMGRTASTDRTGRTGRTGGSEPVEPAGDGLAARLMKGLRGIVGTRPPDAD